MADADGEATETQVWLISPATAAIYQPNAKKN
jgi:hypothetical protein